MRRLRSLLARAEAALFDGPGELSCRERRSIAAGHAQGLLGAVVEKVHRYASRVTDEDVARVRAAGYSEGALYEAIVAAAMGAGLARLRAGLHALGREP